MNNKKLKILVRIVPGEELTATKSWSSEIYANIIYKVSDMVF
jgi:hypothetical protein